MPEQDKITTKIEGYSLLLSNLDKVLFEDMPYVKAQLIAYYVAMKNYILPFIAERPMTLIRYPDGSKGKKFYSKNKPDWTPDWIKSCKMGEEEEVEYLLINKLPDLVWAANLAALELHPMTIKCSNPEHPDHFIIDLDPPDEKAFEVVKNLSLALKKHFEHQGFKTFVKTSGSKGLHIFVPIENHYSHDVLMDYLRTTVTEFLKTNEEATLAFNKDKREGKVLIDIFRNNKNQTCAAAFSTRGNPQASVSMPIFWEDVPELTSSKQFNIENAESYLKTKGNPWEHFSSSAVSLPADSSNQTPEVLEKLKGYQEKRDFSITNEPSPMAYATASKGVLRFALQLHDATKLHYDLRLEEEGVLLSWAIPKGLPVNKEEKRLAVKTEDHPIPYLFFEGEIPRQQYGAGKMWIMDSGTYSLIERKEDAIKFRLKGKKIAGDFNLFQTSEDQWMVRRTDTMETNALPEFDPMLAVLSDKLPKDEDYFFEIKWDGIRVNLRKEGDEVMLVSRGGRDISDKFPEVIDEAKKIKAEHVSIDGELVVLDQDGKPVFTKAIGRLHQKPVREVPKDKWATLYCFDIVYLEGLNLMDQTVEKRKEWVKTLLPESSAILRLSEAFQEGKPLWQAVEQMGLEGIICKKRKSVYQSGKRSDDWLKLKVNNEEEALIIGYTRGEGDRASYFGALHLGMKGEGKRMVYLGKVGTGFDQQTLEFVFRKLKEIPKIKKPIEEKVDEESATIWIEPNLSCKVKYASLTPNGTFREPVFITLSENSLNG